MAEVRDFTGEFARVEAFVRAKSERVEARGLSVHIKFTRARRRDVTGYYRLEDHRIVIAVKKRLRYPRRAAYGVGSMPLAQRHLGRRPYRLVWHEETFTSAEDLLVFVAGHEFWHFLCHSGQRRGDFEVRCNCIGFAWLAEFQRWAGPGHGVAALPLRAARPDAKPASPGAPYRWRWELFQRAYAALQAG